MHIMQPRHHTRPWLWGITAVLACALAACGGGGSTTTTSSLTSAQIIQKANTNFGNDTALHFTLTAQNIQPAAFAVTQAHGDVVRPDKLEIHGLDMPSAGVTAGIGIIFINGMQYLSVGDTGTYTITTILPNLLNIFSPTQGIGAILNQLQNPSNPTSDTVNGVACWRITGTVTSTVLAPITNNPPTTPTDVKTTLWIGQSDFQIHQVTLAGMAAQGDTANTIRTFDLSMYNETVTISVPPTS
jgi:hypothetical protein